MTQHKQGERFGRWVLMTKDHQIGKSKWVCQCKCGIVKSVLLTSLTSGRSQSCGCLSRDVTAKRNMTHGMSHLPEYKHWSAMRDRCMRIKCSSYEHYGGRGIEVLTAYENPTKSKEIG